MKALLSAVERVASRGALLGFCEVSDPDEAVKAAIHAAVQAGRYELAGKLIEVAASASAVLETPPQPAVLGKAVSAS